MSSPSPIPPPPLPVARPPIAPRLIVAAVSLALFFTACALPAIHLDNGDVWNGAFALLMGWMALLLGQFAWLANVLLLAAFVFLFLRWWRTAALLSLLGLLVGLNTFTMLHSEIPLDEGGVKKAFVSAFGPAVYVWLSSMATLAIGALALPFLAKDKR